MQLQTKAFTFLLYCKAQGQESLSVSATEAPHALTRAQNATGGKKDMRRPEDPCGTLPLLAVESTSTTKTGHTIIAHTVASP